MGISVPIVPDFLILPRFYVNSREVEAEGSPVQLLTAVFCIQRRSVRGTNTISGVISYFRPLKVLSLGAGLVDFKEFTRI